ncbi:hypothetical protein Taro_042623 [Colocasia esculenta]|uniref:Uncharacterized protein n=1 Tax=Colocasia esculenta TaxID=4460 RepID=A0A843WTC6_COLES|nr:hypothetical protein [Colocasia esculenta]
MLTWERACEIAWEKAWESWAWTASDTCTCTVWARRDSIVWARRDSKPEIVSRMKPIISLGVPGAPRVVNALVCEAELEVLDNTLLVSILCPKPYTWPFFGAPDAATHTSVDTPIDSVDTGYQSLKQFHEDKVQCVDTVPGSVDTRPSLQKTQLPDWDSVSTQPCIPRGERPDFSRKGCGGCKKGRRGAEQCCLEGEREEEEKRRGERIKYQHPEREQSSAIRLRSRRAAKEEEELAIRMPLKQSIVD